MTTGLSGPAYGFLHVVLEGGDRAMQDDRNLQKASHSRLRDVVIAALVSAAIVEVILHLLEWVGLGHASREVLNEAFGGLNKLTPWKLAGG
jgi:hypothetical protein